VARLVCEQANLRAAYRHLRARGDANGALAFATGLWRFMFGQGHLREGLQLLEEALGDDCVRTQDRRYADALHAAGTSRWRSATMWPRRPTSVGLWRPTAVSGRFAVASHLTCDLTSSQCRRIPAASA
jgi:hypothetical protein